MAEMMNKNHHKAQGLTIQKDWRQKEIVTVGHNTLLGQVVKHGRKWQRWEATPKYYRPTKSSLKRIRLLFFWKLFDKNFEVYFYVHGLYSSVLRKGRL